jgi:hypothetical protein
MAAILFRPLTVRWKMRKRTDDGGSMRKLAADFIKPNDRLTPFERVEIYNRCYWFRILDCFYDDYPGLLAILGNRKFLKLATAYLERYPSESFTLRNLGSRLERFLLEEPQWTAPRQEMALDIARFEWAQIVAFDGPSETPISADDILDVPPERLRLRLQPIATIRRIPWSSETTPVKRNIATPTPSKVNVVRTGLRDRLLKAKKRNFIGSPPRIAPSRTYALVHVQNAGCAFGHLGVVGDDDERLVELATQCAHEFHHRFSIFAVEIASGLVGQHQRRIGHDGPRDSHTLFLSAAQLPGQMVFAVRESHDLSEVTTCS